MRIIDLTGRTFGKLTVIRRGENYISPQGVNMITWLCKCSCGNRLTIVGNSLKRGLSKSCGCYHIETTRKKFIKDLSGMKFGRLTVISLGEFSENSKSNKVRWNCKCECGKETLVRASDLTTGNTTSCGCYLEERKYETKFNDLKGRTFGNLKILKVDHVFRRTYWLCECICTKKVIKSQDDLTSGKVKSCGCLRESFIASKLKIYFSGKYNVVLEHKVIRNPDTHQWLKCDIYICDKKAFIEINGIQHYELNAWHRRMAKSKGTTPEEEFEYQKKKDRMKRKFARKNGIYIEIDLRKIKSTEKAIVYIEKLLKNKSKKVNK